MPRIWRPEKQARTFYITTTKYHQLVPIYVFFHAIHGRTGLHCTPFFLLNAPLHFSSAPRTTPPSFPLMPFEVLAEKKPECDGASPLGSVYIHFCRVRSQIVLECTSTVDKRYTKYTNNPWPAATEHSHARISEVDRDSPSVQAAHSLSPLFFHKYRNAAFQTLSVATLPRRPRANILLICVFAFVCLSHNEASSCNPLRDAGIQHCPPRRKY